MKSFLTAFLLLLTLSVSAQEIKYYNSDWKEVQDKAEAKYYSEITQTNSPAGLIKTDKSYFISGQLLEVKSVLVIDENRKKVIGDYFRWFENGKLQVESHYNNEGQLDGYMKSFYKTGEQRRNDLYQAGKLIKGQCFTKAGKDTTYYPYEVSAGFRGGIKKLSKFLIKNLKYPKEAQQQNIEGKVLVQFVVNTDGSVSDAVLLKNSQADLDNEALRVVEAMPKWVPAKQEGVVVKQKMVLPITFKLNN